MPKTVLIALSALAILVMLGHTLLQPAQAQTAVQAGGAIRIGADSRACAAGLVGAMRYETVSNRIQACLVTNPVGPVYGWVNWG